MGDFLPYLIKLLPALVLLLLLGLALRRLNARSRLTGLVFAYLGMALAVESGGLGWLGVDLQTRTLLDSMGALLSALLIFHLVLSVGFSSAPFWPIFLSLAWALALALMKNIVFLFGSWLAFGLGALALVFYASRKANQPMLRNLLSYFYLVIGLTLVNDVLIFYNAGLRENILRVGAAALLTYLALRTHLPDTRDLFRQFLTYLTTSLLTILIYLAGMQAAQQAFGGLTGFNPQLAGATVAVIISIIFAPMLGAVRGLFNRLFRIETYDASQTLREYSASTSNILDLEKLATVAVGIIMQTLEVRKGFLFLVDPELAEGGYKIYRLTGIRGAGSQAKAAGLLAGDSPIVRHFMEEREALLQYDLDFAPTFLEAPVSERKWMSALGMDVYVPIYSKGEWIGLLALGPTGSGRRYTEEDLNLLAAIAGQTGVALENARLVENLKKLNTQIREAYTYLDKANHDLAVLEMTKSNFISIASHELRTPLTAMRGYAEMLLENETISDDVRGFIKGIHKSTLRLHEIMDSMFDIAQLDARTKEMHREEVFVTDLLRSVAQELSGAVTEREQLLSLDIPQLSSIKADPNTLRKLFYHLTINAIKYTPNKGKITVTARQLSPNNRDLPEGGVEIIFSDTGVGVDKDSREVIFTKFYQPGELLRHSTGKTKFKGSGAGLGLALSRGIVEAHGGKIWVESEGYDEEKCPGSDFHVILPARSQGESKTVRMGSAMKLRL